MPRLVLLYLQFEAFASDSLKQHGGPRKSAAIHDPFHARACYKPAERRRNPDAQAVKAGNEFPELSVAYSPPQHTDQVPRSIFAGQQVSQPPDRKGSYKKSKTFMHGCARASFGALS
jgi:hypothetical protein